MQHLFRSYGHFSEGWILPFCEASAVEGLQSTGLPHLVLNEPFPKSEIIFDIMIDSKVPVIQSEELQMSGFLSIGGCSSCCQYDQQSG